MSSVALLDSNTLRAWRCLRSASDAVSQRVARDLEEATGIPLEWYIVLVCLYESGGEVLQHKLDRTTNLSQSGTSRMVSKIESAGLVEREMASHDRRNLVLRLTDKGRDVLLRATPVHNEAVQRHFGKYLSEEDSVQIEDLLERIRAGGEPETSTRPLGQVVTFGESLLAVTADTVVVGDALRTRDALELALLLDVAHHVPSAAAGELRAAVAAMAQNIGDPEAFFRADWALHRELARHCQNVVLRDIYLQLLSVISESDASVIPTDGLADYLDQRLAIHARLVEAVLSGGETEVAAAVDAHHFTSVMPRLLAQQRPLRGEVG